MRDKIWYELVQMKHGEIYLAHYLTKQKVNKKYFKIITLIFSSGGLLSWSIWQNGILAAIACAIVAVIQVLNLIENQLILNDRDLEKIAELRNLYLNQLKNLEHLWERFNSGKISEYDVTEEFYQLKGISNDIEALDNKLEIQNIKNLINISDKETRDYINYNYKIML